MLNLCVFILIIIFETADKIQIKMFYLENVCMGTVMNQGHFAPPTDLCKKSCIANMLKKKRGNSSFTFFP